MNISEPINAICSTLFETLVIPGICLIGIFLIVGIALLIIKESGRQLLKNKFQKITNQDTSYIPPSSINENSIHQPNDMSTRSRTSSANICPLCGAKLVLRTARKGQNAGQQFWGCSSFPSCRYTKNID